MVALPSVLILCVAAGFVCWLREREKQRRQSELAAAGGQWSGAYVVEPSLQTRQQQAVLETGQHSRQALTSGSAGCRHFNNEVVADSSADRRASSTNYYFERHRQPSSSNTSTIH